MNVIYIVNVNYLYQNDSRKKVFVRQYVENVAFIYFASLIIKSVIMKYK